MGIAFRFFFQRPDVAQGLEDLLPSFRFVGEELEVGDPLGNDLIYGCPFAE